MTKPISSLQTSQFNTDSIDRGIVRLIDTLGQMVDDIDADLAPERMDKLARAITAQLKARTEVIESNAKAARSAQQENYTAYEDIPPPSPADRERLRERLRHLIDKITDGGAVSISD